MKKILIALFIIFVCGKTFAEPTGGFIPPIPPIYAHPDVVEYAIKKYVVAPYDPNKVTAAYEQYMNQNDGTITLENLQQKVCPASGMDYARCKEFTNALMIPYYDVCDSGKGKSGGNEHCEKNFFYYAAPKNLSFGNGTYVRTKEAIGLAQEYALVKDKQKVVCVSTKGNSKKTDTIWCTSIDKKHFYEFKFNNIKETKDDYIKQSVLRAVCKMHNTTYTVGGVGAATIGDAPGLSYPDSCETDNKVICGNINKSLNRFSYKSQIGTSDVPPIGKHSTCVIEKVVNDISNLRSAYGIDNTVFKNVQVLAGEDIDNKIKQYVKQELQKQKITFNEKAFYCATSTNVLNGGEVLTCYVNNKPIDFLFKDLSEWSGVNKRGGAQAMDCIVSGGTYTGKRCTNLNQKQCEMLRSANLKSCPSCNMVRWDAENEVCALPSSAAATNLQKDMKVVAIVGGAVVGGAITIATAGTAGLTLGGYIILGVETTGAGIELWSQSKIDGIADELFMEANNCHDQNCAEQVVRGYFEYLSRMTRDLTKDEKTAIDNIMANLIELLPSDSQFLIDTVAGCYEENDDNFDIAKCDDGVWNPEQVIRAVGIGLQFTSVFASVGTWILRKAGMIKTIANQAPNMTKALQKKIPETKEAIVESTNKGKVLKTSNGKEPLWIRAFKNTIPEVEARINRLLDDIFAQKLSAIERLQIQQTNKEREFIARNKGMLFHASATDYKDGTVEALSQAWQIHTTPGAKGLLFADPDFYTVKPYAKKFNTITMSVKDYPIENVRLKIPEQFRNKFNTREIILSDKPRAYGYVYAVKPDGFRPAGGSDTFMMIEHDVERVDRILIPLDEDVIFVSEQSLADITKDRFNHPFLQASRTADAVDNSKTQIGLLRNLLIYEDYLKELSKIIK